MRCGGGNGGEGRRDEDERPLLTMSWRCGVRAAKPTLKRVGRGEAAVLKEANGAVGLVAFSTRSRAVGDETTKLGARNGHTQPRKRTGLLPVQATTPPWPAAPPPPHSAAPVLRRTTRACTAARGARSAPWQGTEGSGSGRAKFVFASTSSSSSAAVSAPWTCFGGRACRCKE